MIKRFILLLLFNAGLPAQTEFENFLSYVYSIPSNLRQAATDSFYVSAVSTGVPFVEDTQAVFLYRGAASAVYVAGDFNGWDYTNGKASIIESTNLFYLKKTFESDARLDYKFVINGSNWILDPANPNVIWGGFGPNSELAMPFYVQPWEIKYNASVPHGRKITQYITSTFVGKSFKVFVLLPAEYNNYPDKKYPVVYFQDGEEYIELASAINVVDNLIAADSTAPIIAVFVKPNNRNEEYAFSKRNNYAKFFAEELVPFIDNNYRTVKLPNFRLVLGDSYGGNISALIAFRYPEIFGNCGLHSAAFQPNGYEVYNLWLDSDVLPVRFYSVWGTYEGLNDNMNNFKNQMIQKGYDIQWRIFHEGHSWGLWRTTIDLMLIKFFPPDLTSVNKKSVVPENFSLYQNYPNPFNPSTVIKYSIPLQKTGVDAQRLVQLNVYDLLGRRIATLVNENKAPGNYEVEFNATGLSSGVYIYRLKTGDFIKTGKMLLMK